MSLAKEKADKLMARIDAIEKRERRNVLLESGILIECSLTARRAGISEKVAMARNLWREVYPWAEDAVKGAQFEELLWDMFKIYKKELYNRIGVSKYYGEFSIITKTYVKEVVAGEIKTFADGKARDKRLKILVIEMPDETGAPSIVFGLGAAQWLSNVD